VPKCDEESLITVPIVKDFLAIEPVKLCGAVICHPGVHEQQGQKYIHSWRKGYLIRTFLSAGDPMISNHLHCNKKLETPSKPLRSRIRVSWRGLIEYSGGWPHLSSSMGGSYDLCDNTIFSFVPFKLNAETPESKPGGSSAVYPVYVHAAHHQFWNCPKSEI